MAHLWEKAKAGTKRTKIQGELVLLDREIKNRQLSFGVELYDILIADPKSFGGSIVGQNVKVSQLQHRELAEPLEACKSDIQALEAQQQACKTEQDHLAHQRENYGPASTAGEKFSKVGNWVTTNTQELSLSAKHKMIDRDINRRKEQFGIQVFEHYIVAGLADAEPQQGSSIREKMSTAMGQSSPKEKKVQDCLYRAKNMVAMLERQKDLGLREIEGLNEILHG
mmetsp:Transcript_15768/g.20573  ORF Transcript_15768/g.20573 Transcript_15768/m.20573 type:complete len:225 (-) Transcript_15768:90-764(-)|eukprot:CAMPEP_0198136658 /NCGR_PEP_ID=MMETSP1443-20131203/294_1 /TAXON_ID=186043 /ORGANISM="Entomoneis sp., Strain CCMP2396" /LENGTH=224 /DNA_ID=CAMNT_0043797915 /DNA_START=126 /DNA_END=800 /DNA_ORIENTATION=+